MGVVRTGKCKGTKGKVAASKTQTSLFECPQTKIHLVETGRKPFSSLNLPRTTWPVIWKTCTQLGLDQLCHHVDLLMADEVAVAIKAFPTFVAMVRSLPCVASLMLDEK